MSDRDTSATAARPDEASTVAHGLDEILAIYLEKLEQGEAVGSDRAVWIGRYPEFATELAQFFVDQDRLAQLLEPLRDSEGARPAKVPAQGDCLGDYEIQSEIARGGMGIVFKAVQRSLGRVVALKVVLSGPLASGQELQRFRLEAEAVASLDHPHIVPVYEVGEQDGWHFYSMKYIDGGSLGRLELVRPLTHKDQVRVADLLATVAAAVSHAHQHGLLHRDLKPANILLDRDGAPHVTDFGLAKRLHGSTSGSADLAETPTGTAVGTPSYMAPEQALGPRDATTTADVYSLGCILYELLTGRPPFRADTPLATLLDVLRRDPRRPRELCPSLDRDLETVCLKCLERDPKKRYQSAEDLAADLRRFVQGVPVLARSPGGVERLVRWCRRRPWLAAGIGAAVAFVCLAFGLITWQWQRAESNYEIGQGHLNTANREKAEAERQTRLAVEQTQLAEKRLRLAHALVDEFCLRLSEEGLRPIPGTQVVRRELLEKSRDYLEEFVRERQDDPALKRKLARARHSLGVVLEALGSREQALREFQAAAGLLEELLRLHPGDDDLTILLARTQQWVGIAYIADDNAEPALERYRRAQTLFAGLVTRRPEDPIALADLADAESQIGNLQRGRGELDAALHCFERSLAIRRRLRSDHPDDPRFKSSLAVTCFNYGGVLSDLGRRKEGLALFREARDLGEELVKAFPSDTHYRRELAQVLRMLGEDERLSGAAEKSVAICNRVRAMLESLSAANPQVVQFKRDLAATERELGHAQGACGRRDEAVLAYRRARDVMKRAINTNGDLPELANDLAKCYFDLGTVLPTKQEAFDALEKARVLREKVVQAHPNNLGYTYDLARTEGNLGIASWNLKRTEDALAHTQRAIDLDEKLSKTMPGAVKYRHTLGAHYGQLASFLWSAGRPKDALEIVRKRVKTAGGDGTELFRSARDLAQVSQGAGDKNGREMQQHAAALIIEVLDQAVKCGFRDVPSVERTDAFAVLRERPDFQAILVKMSGSR